LKYAVFAGVPRSRIVYYRIGIGSSRLRGVRRIPYRWLFRRPGTIGAVSRDVADDLLTYGVERGRVRVIPNARDASRYRVDRAPDDRGMTRLVFVGRLVESKRPLLFVDIVQSLSSLGLAIRAVVAGSGPLHEKVRAAARDAPIQVVGEVEDVRQV